ncbi:hypothetical protein DL771_007605 [Monosporascus sp. 5C6A]|nr:hypothetical protein DL771_007605 [Monosporascus sp. 5C6A]
MSFRSDDQRRYGHVPPVQYPVPGQSPSSEQPAAYPSRRLSFNNGDDPTSAFNRASTRPPYQPTLSPTGRGFESSGDELFLANATSETNRPSLYTNTSSAMSGYQHQYHASTPPTPSTYNPQAFARSQSTNLPYHPQPGNRWAQSNNATSPTATNFAPAPYIPAAYSAAASAPQRHLSYSGYNSYSGNSTPAYGSPSLNQPPYFQSQPTYLPPAQPAQASTPYTGYDQATPSSTYSVATSLGVPPHTQGIEPSYSQYSPGYSNSTTGSTPTPYPSATSQAPYPTYSQIPVGPNYSAADPHSFLNHATRSGSNASPLPSPPAQLQSSPGLARHPTNAPLPSRPVDDISEDPYGQNGGVTPTSRDDFSQDDIIRDIEAELERGGGPQRGRPSAVDQRNGVVPDNDLHNLRRLGSSASYHSTATTLSIQDEGSGVNRYSSNASTLNRNHSNSPYATLGDDDDGDESDPEGAAGAYALQQAEEDDRFFSGAGVGMPFPYLAQPEVPVQTTLPTHKEESGSDSEYGMDLGLVGGGYAGTLAYDDNLASPPVTDTIPLDAQAHTPRRNHPSQRSHDSSRYPAFERADVDYGGTGGLHTPPTHRLSFDEGDERVSLHSRQSSNDSPPKDDYPDMFYHPGLTNRPLPPVPTSDSSSMLSVTSPNQAGYQQGYSQNVDSPPYTGPDAQYGQNAQQLQVERSISLSNHNTTPQVQPPGRSKTDAAEERCRVKLLRHQQQLAQQGLPYESYDATASSSISNYDMITLPSGRRRKFQPEKLTAADVRTCTEPWALSGIARWIREMADGEPDLKRKTVEYGLVRLFCLKVPTMNVADAETLGCEITNSMLEAGILVPDEEWLKFGQGSISGVLWQLTGSGCYAPKLHEYDAEAADHAVGGRCYSHHCTRTLKKANVDELMAGGVKVVDWETFYGVTKESVEGKPRKEITRQNILHEIVTTEETYMDQIEILRTLYRDRLLYSQPPIIAEGRIEKFVNAVFGKAESIQNVNKNYLLAQLKYRQKEQGPWIVGFSDIFREWIRKARGPYVEYASAYPYAHFLVKREAERNYMFKQFLNENQNDKRSQKLDWSTYLKAPITRLQRYILLMQTVSKHMPQDSEEKANLGKAIEETQAVASEADSKVHEMQKKVTMIELDQMLVLRPGYQASLNLDHLGRELILQGDLQRMGSKGVRWVDTHALLFDHYLILAKLVTSRDGRQDKKYDVSKEPIPMPLLFLDSSQDDPVSKQKGLGAPLTRATNTASDTRLNKMATNGTDRPGLEHAATTSSMGSTAVTRLAPAAAPESEGKILYPFRVKHLGHEVYTLFAPSHQTRQDWCDRIIEAKTRHAKALHAQNAEPFRLRVMADSAFSYDAVNAIGKYVGGVHIRGTPLDRAIRDVEKSFGPGRGPPPICRANVYCATGFSAFGRNMVAVGTDIGVCVSEASDQRGWHKAIAQTGVRQIAVLEEFSIVLVLADRCLLSYPLDMIAPPSSYPAPASDNLRRAPQRLAKDVAFFATARMKDRMLVFYKKKEGMHNSFKILEPVYLKASERRTRFFGNSRRAAGVTESFRDYDEFYLPIECYSINIFNAYIAVSTAKGFELLTLDKKIPMSIPDVKQPAIANIANRIKDQRPLGMFRLNDQEFLLAYEDCAVYVDKHGDVSRSVIMEYSGKQKKAKGATMYGQYLILFNEDYVEVRNAENGRLRQIIAGRDVKVLDYGVRGPTGGSYQTNGNGHLSPTGDNGIDSKGTVKIGMAHPEVAGQQIILEMLLNNGHTEK